MTVLDGIMFGFGACCGIFAFTAMVALVALVALVLPDPGKKKER